ncbi:MULTISPECIES: hypothetical protein [Pseudomonas]|uniref:Uncharacterized protein n=1 Tax=Pseudomonas putida TaxID=303 RepID=A0A177SCP5_PSEPU|nr:MULTISPECIES: hypothetical protein [Pseudomonas]MDG9883800.1 hypothetical protein [Pseudomonas sp. GD04058]OAI86130.1 hypothetical protein AYO28_00085 [Pseudomonas putida]
MARHLFLISYIQNNQPGTCELYSEEETLTPEQAAAHLQGLQRGDAASFSDVQVQRLEHDHEPGTTPGHYQQP